MRPLLFYVQDDYDTSWPNLLNVLWSEKKKLHPSVTFVLVSHFKKLWKHINTVRRFCPQVYEVVPCQSDCNQYVWVAEPWSVWKVSNVDLKENCGEGVQTRKVRYLSSSLSYCVSVFLLFLYITDTSLLNMSWINAEMMSQYAYWSVYQQKLCNNCFGYCRCAAFLLLLVICFRKFEFWTNDLSKQAIWRITELSMNMWCLLYRLSSLLLLIYHQRIFSSCKLSELQ